jgi:hypothetical protein
MGVAHKPCHGAGVLRRTERANAAFLVESCAALNKPALDAFSRSERGKELRDVPHGMGFAYARTSEHEKMKPACESECKAKTQARQAVPRSQNPRKRGHDLGLIRLKVEKVLAPRALFVS